MSRCRHTCWLKPWSIGVETGLEVTDRPQRLLRDFDSPANEAAGLLVLVGNQSKQAAFRKLTFQTERIHARTGGEVHLLTSLFREFRCQRVVIADTDIPGRQLKPPSLNAKQCHEVKVYAGIAQTVSGEPRYSHASLLHGILFPSADVVCIFVNDLGGFSASLEQLTSWLKRGAPTSSPVRPQILLVVNQEEKERHQVVLQRFVDEKRSGELASCFRGITIVGVPRLFGRGRRQRCKPTRRWQVLSPAIARALEASRQSRRRSNSLFSVYHLAQFLQLGAGAATDTTLGPYSFVKFSRLHRAVASDLSRHLVNFLESFTSASAVRRIAVSLIASSFLLDHYSPGMHRESEARLVLYLLIISPSYSLVFDCHQVFHELYEADCSRASAEFRPKFKGSIPPAEIVRLISSSMYTQFAQFQALGPSVDWHRKQLSRYKDLMKSIRLRETCLSCIRRRPQYGFPCGHLICRNCVRVFYPPSDSDPWQYRLETCHICSEPTPGLSVYLTPDTSQLRVLSVDGGGIRGSAPIGFLKSIQDEIGIPGYKVQRNFDVKIGTSSGALSVISLDVLGWSVDDCMSHLKRFAKESFVQRCPDFLLRLCRLPFVSSVVWLLQLVYALLADSKYDVNGLERLLQDTYGSDRCITDLSTATVMGTYVGVTLTKARDGSVYLATNYNGTGVRSQNLDYRHLESDDGQKLVKWWEVLRCATAAPFYFAPKRIGDLGVFQDGGLAVNNPACIAVREAISLGSDTTEPSLVVSLGTGSTVQDEHGPSGLLSRKFPSRLWRALWRQTGSRTTWDHLLSHQGVDSNTRYFRFDLEFPGKEPLLDEVSKMDHVQQTARDAVSGTSDLHQLCRHLRAELFLFALDEQSLPYFANGGYHCSGHITCRLRAQTPEYEAFINQLCEREASFQVGAQILRVTPESIREDLSYRVHFVVPSRSSLISIMLTEGTGERFDVSGSPFTLEWLVQRQQLDASFGTSDHRKRKLPGWTCIPRAKRARL